MKEFLRDIGINIGIVVAGFAGSLVNVGKNAHTNWPATIASILAGTLSANYLTPIAVEFLKLGQSTQYGCAFLMGFLGLHGVRYILKKLGVDQDED